MRSLEQSRWSSAAASSKAGNTLRNAMMMVQDQVKHPQVYSRLVKSKKAAQLLLQVALSMTTSTIDNTSSLIDETMDGACQLLEVGVVGWGSGDSRAGGGGGGHP